MNKNIIIIIFLTLCSFAYAQIPSGYYDGTEGLSGDDLKSILNDIIDAHVEFPYTSNATDVWDILKETDRDPDNSENVILLYTGCSVNAAQEYNNGQGWNREHVWAKSHGDFGTAMGAGTDVHHLRPSDIQVNGDRGNLDFDNSDNPYPGIPGCFYDSNSWEPRDEVKGDVARMIFYMATRYEGENGELDLVVVDEVNTFPNPEHGKLSTLLEWNLQDLPDDFEENRNNKIYDNWQGNRNPFIDHPEFADLIWENTSVENEYLFKDKYALSNYPNPLTKQNTGTQINFNIPNNIHNVSIDIYNIKGQIIKHLIPATNNQSVNWAGTDKNNKEVKSGIYFINLKIDNKNIVAKKCLVIH